MNCVIENLKKCTVAGLVLFAAGTALGQENLVPNGSFEATDGKVKKLAAIESANGWTSPTGVRADLFTPSKIAEINTPINKYGKEDAKEGSNYAGIVAYSFGDKVPRSYLMAKFDAPLKKGMKYCVQFHVSLAEASKYAANNLGAVISKKEYATDSKTPIIEKASILHFNNKVFNATYNWDKVCSIFEAQGGEKYITIGNFEMNDKVKQETNKKSKDKDMKLEQVIAAYYYIDDVSVTLVKSDQECDCMLSEKEDEYSPTIYQKAVVLNDKMTPQEKIEAQALYFAFGKYNFQPVAEDALDLIAETMKANPQMKLQVLGHSCAQEDEVGKEKEKFADMALKRTDAVMKYLMDKGIEESRLIASPMGNEEPSAEIEESDDDDLKMAKNRRVVFKVR
jgi:outer membrane protein OmpA-like peptidoglycan-associated protein